MSELNRNTPIIVKKINKHGGHHGGAWKVAYADFVTAMMALFIVLWVLGQDTSVKEAVARGGLDLVHALVQVQERDVEGTAA